LRETTGWEILNDIKPSRLFKNKPQRYT